ncbi:MAG TPA: hypothetical protein VJ201_09055, partial [Candidatus Babeliales bacterium]|nr:hypothetical protein [Candidatus Babeliales bacterium]
AEAGLRGKLSTEHSRIQESSTQHGIGRSIDITAEEAQRFSKDLHKVEEYSKTSHADTSSSTSASQLSQLSTDLRNARSASEQHAIHKAESERLSNAASYVRQHSGQIDSDLGQEIANSVVMREGREEAERLFAGKDRPKLEALAKEYLRDSGVESSIISRYQQDSSGINPEQKYREAEAEIDAKTNSINLGHESYKRKIDADAKAVELGVDEQKSNQIKDAAENQRNMIGDELKDAKGKQNKQYKNMHDEVAQNIEGGGKKAKSSAYSIGDSVKPDYSNADKNKK